MSSSAYDVSAGRAVVAWDERADAFQAAVVLYQDRAAARPGAPSPGKRCSDPPWAVRFDDGYESRVGLGALRERWGMPLRTLCLWGNYHSATVLESLGGLIRLDFGGGNQRWALPEQILGASPPSEADLAVGAYVAADFSRALGGSLGAAEASAGHLSRGLVRELAEQCHGQAC